MHPPIPSTTHLPTVNATCKRALDVAFSGIALVLLAPLLAIAAVIIRLDSKGPILQRQRRVGRFGKPFALLKFRSLSDQSTGRWLRTTGVEQLPQLLNVLYGDMSLIGPRPKIASELSHLQPSHHEQHGVLPGIIDVDR